MNDDTKMRMATAAVSLVLVVVYAGFLVYFTRRDDVRTRLLRSREWARYYMWRAKWDSLPTWFQEALIVRGKGPVE